MASLFNRDSLDCVDPVVKFSQPGLASVKTVPFPHRIFLGVPSGSERRNFCFCRKLAVAVHLKI